MQLRKDNEYTVLVSGASGIVGYGILRCLKESRCRLIGITIYNESPANCFADFVENPPLTADESYIPWLIDTIKKYNVDMIIPGIEADMECWNKNRSLIESTGVLVMLNRKELIDLCLDKWKFYEILEENKCSCRIESTLYSDYNIFNTPFILKPRCGFGSKGVVKVENKEQFLQYRDAIGSKLMMQQFVGTTDEEYTVSAFFDKDSKIRASMGMKRKLSKQGFTEIAQVVQIEDLMPVILELAHIFRPIGPTNFQFRKCNDYWKLLEINPRISSSTSIRKSFGYNESKMCIDFFLLDKEIKQTLIKPGRAIRYIEDYIIYDSNNI